MNCLTEENHQRGFCTLAEAICARLNHNLCGGKEKQVNISGNGSYMKYVNQSNEIILELDSEKMEATIYRAFSRYRDDDIILVDMVALLEFCGFKITVPAF